MGQRPSHATSAALIVGVLVTLVSVGQPRAQSARSGATVTVTVGNPGDHWASQLDYTRIVTAKRDGQYGYEVTFRAADGCELAVFWPRSQIHLRGRAPSYRMRKARVRTGWLYFPDYLTARSLPEVHAWVLYIDADRARQANAAIAAMQGFGVVAAVGALGPAPRVPVRAPTAARTAPARTATHTASRGGARPHAIGKAGEAAVRAVYHIGPKIRIKVHGRTRIPDGLTRRVLTEVKNVKSLSYTRQLRDFADFARRHNLRFDLFVRTTTKLSRPLLDAWEAGYVNLRYIPQ